MRHEVIVHSFVEHALERRERDLLERFVVAIEKLTGPDVPIELSEAIKQAAASAQAVKAAQEQQGP